MKIFLLMSDFDSIPVAGFIVPDDFDLKAVVRQWTQETATPYVGRNQYGPYTSKKYNGKPTKSWYNWLAERYEEVELIFSDSE